MVITLIACCYHHLVQHLCWLLVLCRLGQCGLLAIKGINGGVAPVVLPIIHSFLGGSYRIENCISTHVCSYNTV